MQVVDEGPLVCSLLRSWHRQNMTAKQIWGQKLGVQDASGQGRQVGNRRCAEEQRVFRHRKERLLLHWHEQAVVAQGNRKQAQLRMGTTGCLSAGVRLPFLGAKLHRQNCLKTETSSFGFSHCSDPKVTFSRVQFWRKGLVQCH